MSGRVQRRRAIALPALAWLIVATPAARAADPAASYREALAHQADGDETGALRRLAALETGSIEAGLPVERLREIELDVIDRLPGVVPEAILPAVVLHERAYLLYRSQGSEWQAVHSRTLMYLLGELFAARADTVERRRLAGDLLATVGGYFRESSTGTTGMKLFQRALELDRTNQTALLGAAIAEEQRGRYDRALRYLETLERAHPGGRQVRLRLAINLARAGDGGRARDYLERLLEGGAPRWILSLAHQALARLLIDAGDMEAAHGVLAAGVASDATDPALAIALAWIAERRAVDDGGSALRGALERSARAPGGPPRYRYSRDPIDHFRRAREQLRLRAVGGRPALADALAGGPADPG